MLKSQMKTMLMTFCSIKGTVHFELIPQGQKVNQVYYVAIFKQLHEAVCRRRPNFGPTIGLSTMTVHQVMELSVKQSVSGPKIN
jgi:hypothetical protein